MIHKVIFIGSKKTGFKFLKTIFKIAPRKLQAIITIDDRNDSRSSFSDFQIFSKQKRIPLFVVKNKNHFNHTIHRLQPELCLVCGWYCMIENAILKFVPHGFIGIHFSKLPAYRGGSPLVWAMIRGERSVGVSLFQLTAKTDAGDLWGQAEVSIKQTDDIADVLKKLELKTIFLLKKKYLKILEEKSRPVHQGSRDISYFSPRLPKDGKINWQSSSLDIFNFIKAQTHPYPGAFTFIKGLKILIWKAYLLNKATPASAGEIVDIQKNKIFISCGDKKIIVFTDIEFANKKIAIPFSIKDRFH